MQLAHMQLASHAIVGSVLDIGKTAQRRTGEGRALYLSLLKTKQLPLFSPVDGYLERQSHQLLGCELRRVFAVDNGGDDVGSQRRKTQKARDVAFGNALLAGNNMHGRSVFCIRRAWMSCARAMILSRPTLKFRTGLWICRGAYPRLLLVVQGVAGCGTDGSSSVSENRHLQHQRRQQAACQSLGLATPSSAGRFMPAGAEGDRFRISNQGN